MESMARSFRSPRKTNCGIALPSSRGGLAGNWEKALLLEPFWAVACREHAVADVAWRAQRFSHSHRPFPDAASGWEKLVLRFTCLYNSKSIHYQNGFVFIVCFVQLRLF
jgi:hypothetical protein